MSSSLRFRLVATVFLAMLPALLVLPFSGGPWIGFAIGLLALVAAWFGGEHFVLRQVRALLQSAQRWSAGDLHARTGLAGDRSELGQLARMFDGLVAAIEQQIEQRQSAEHRLARRAQQQTAVAALGHLALATEDFEEFLEHVALFVAETLEVEFSSVLELTPDGQWLRLQAGHGWKSGRVGELVEAVVPDTHSSHILSKGEPVVVANLRTEQRFRISDLLREHGAVSSASVAITLRAGCYGILGAHSAKPHVFTEDQVHFLLAVATLLTVAIERKRAEAELKKLADFAQLNPNPAIELTPDGAVAYFNEAALRLASVVGRSHPGEILPPEAREIVRGCLETRQSRLRHETKVEGRTFSWSFHPVTQPPAVHCYVEDITDRLSLEAQLRQSQKMECVGQLAAGVAHDFNNLLTIIQGHAGMFLSKPDLPPKLRESSQAVYGAAERAAGLTRQLLMFSRKNLMQTQPLDLREVLGNLSKMLQRLLGETVTLHFESPPALPLVQADAGMLEQVLMNLAVNARDAMPQGGQLTITLGTETLGEPPPGAPPQARPGRFVRLQVSDTGCGMSAATLARIFEPFFTTKEPGKGTGLGLATVYGIVEQHEGWVEVASEVGRGTTFTIFLPAIAQPPEPVGVETPIAATGPVRGGKQTLLIVEDEPVLREMAVEMLGSFGYQIVAVGSGVEALGVWQERDGKFDLLLTDMVLPEGMSGLELAAQLRARKPNLKTIFISGYGLDDVGSDTVRELQGRFLQKPYSSETLARAIREFLDEPRR
ncbi:MAG TPA: ATP-binding protein [Verrucomicrobiae bacterium]